MRQRGVLGILVLLVLVGAMGCSAAVPETAPSTGASMRAVSPEAFAGQWDGGWVGVASGGLYVTMVLDNGALRGTLRATGTQTFGSDEKTLEGIYVRGRTLGFTTQGGGGPFDVSVTLSPDGKALSGMGVYQGSRYAVNLRRKG